SLWRGPALAEFASEPFAPTEAARLEELRMHALEGRLDADLELGRHGTLVGELEALIARYPLRDGLRRQHMLALYRSGRQAEAPPAYHEARRALADELGIEPSAGLRELERRILEQDASLEVTISPPTRGPIARQGRARGENRLPERLTQSAAAPFVGRSEQLEHLTGLLDQTAAGQGALVVIAGEGGIGKTRLVAALAGAARQFAVLYGRCEEEMPPFGPWAEALTRHFAALSDRDLESLLDGHAPYAARLVPELRLRLPEISLALVGDPEEEQHRLFSAIAALVELLAEHEPLLLVLDDLHWADRSSLLLLRQLAGGSLERVLLVGTF